MTAPKPSPIDLVQTSLELLRESTRDDIPEERKAEVDRKLNNITLYIRLLIEDNQE